MQTMQAGVNVWLLIPCCWLPCCGHVTRLQRLSAEADCQFKVPSNSRDVCLAGCSQPVRCCLQLLALGCESGVHLASLFVDDLHQEGDDLLRQSAQHLRATEPLPGEGTDTVKQQADSQRTRTSLADGLVMGDWQQRVRLELLCKVSSCLCDEGMPLTALFISARSLIKRDPPALLSFWIPVGGHA